MENSFAIRVASCSYRLVGVESNTPDVRRSNYLSLPMGAKIMDMDSHVRSARRRYNAWASGHSAE